MSSARPGEGKSLARCGRLPRTAAEMSRELYPPEGGFPHCEDSERNVLSAQNSLVQSNATGRHRLIALYKQWAAVGSKDFPHETRKFKTRKELHSWPRIAISNRLSEITPAKGK